MASEQAVSTPARGTLREIGATFLKLGCVSFGGPIAHLSYFRVEVVDKRKWLDDAHYADLVALCQFLPGPASSQVVFALGMQRAGLFGALVASSCFTLPSALLMIGCAYGVALAGDLRSAGWLHGLKLAAAAVVAQAVWGMGRKLCVDRARVTLSVAAAATLLVAPGAATQLSVIAAGASAGFVLYRRALGEPARVRERFSGEHAAALGALAIFGALLAGLPLLASATGSVELAQFDSFYRSGALVFGGGHVVLPLLRAELVPRGWISDDRFLAGYGAAQAVPGPLFTFAAYLGTLMSPQPHAWLNGLVCLLAIFLPAWLLVAGSLPFWQNLRAQPWAQAALAGANASVVGVLLAALYQPVIAESVHSGRDAAAALIAFVCLEHWSVRPWLIVSAMAAAGQWLL